MRCLPFGLSMAATSDTHRGTDTLNCFQAKQVSEFVRYVESNEQMGDKQIETKVAGSILFQVQTRYVDSLVEKAYFGENKSVTSQRDGVGTLQSAMVLAQYSSTQAKRQYTQYLKILVLL